MQTAQVARGRSSIGSFGASATTSGMGGAEGQVQKSERIEQRLRRLPEALDHRLLRDLGGALALGVTAHAVARDQQRSLLGHGDADAILIGIAPALKAEFCIFDPQASSEALR